MLQLLLCKRERPAKINNHDTMCLSDAMVGILTKNHHFCLNTQKYHYNVYLKFIMNKTF